MAAYIIFNAVILWPAIVHKRKGRQLSEQNMGCRFAVASAIVCQVLACPDLDLCSYWFWVYVSAAYIKTLVPMSAVKTEMRGSGRIEWRRMRRT